MRQIKRFLAFALALMMFMSNTVSASATSAGNGLLSGQNTGGSTQNVVTVEPTSSEPGSAEPTSEPESSVPETSEVPSSEGTSTEPTTTESTSVAETTTEEATTEEPTTEEATTEETSEELTAEVSKDETSEVHTEQQDGDIAYVIMDDVNYYFTSIAAAIAYADTYGTAGEKYTVRQDVGEDTAPTPTFTVSGEDLVTENVSITLDLSYDLSVTGTEATNTAASNVNVFNNNSVGETRPTVKVASGTSLQILEGGWHNLDLTFEGDNGTLILGEEDKTYTSYPVPVNIDSTTVTGLKNLKVYAPTSWGEIAHDSTLSNATRELDSLVVDIQEDQWYGFETSESITAKTVSLDGLLKINNLTVTQSLTAEKTADLWLFGKADIKTLNVSDTTNTDQKFEICRMFLYTDDTFANLSSSASIHLREIPNSMHKMTIQKRKGYYTSQGLLGYQNNTTPYALGDTIVTVTPGEGDTVENFTYMSYYGLELANGVDAYLEPWETDTKGTYDLVLAQDYNEIRLLMFKGEDEEPIAEKGFQTFADVKTYINNKNDGDMKYRILVNEAMSFAGDDLNFADVTAESVGLDMPNKLTATDDAVIVVDDINEKKYNDEGLIPGTYTDIDLKKKSGMSLDIVPRDQYASVEGIRILSNGSVLNLGKNGSEVESYLYLNASVNGKLALLNCYGSVTMVSESAVNTARSTVTNTSNTYFVNLNADELKVEEGSVTVGKANIKETLTIEEGCQLIVESGGILTVKDLVVADDTEGMRAEIYLYRRDKLEKTDSPENPSFAGAEELAPLGSLKITGDVTLGKSGRPIHIVKWREWITSEEDQVGASPVEFDNGETIATVTNTKIPASYFSIDGNNATVEHSGSYLKATKATVEVVRAGDGKVATYSSFEQAVGEMANDFNRQPGRYDFYLLEDATLNANITIPAFVTEMNLCSEARFTEGSESESEENENLVYFYERYLDLNGKTLTTSAYIGIAGGVRIKSGVTKTTAPGKIISNYVGTEDGLFGLRIIEQYTLVNAKGENIGKRACALDNIIVTMKNAYVGLNCEPDSILNDNKDNFDLRASFDVKGFNVQNGSWTLEDISDKNRSYLKTGDLVLTQNSSMKAGSVTVNNGSVILNDSTTLITDSMTLNNVDFVEYDGRIQVKDKLTLSGTTLEIVGELHAKDIISSASWIRIENTGNAVKEEDRLYGNVCVENLTINSAYAGDGMGDYTLDNQGSLLVSNNLTMKAGTLCNVDTVEAGTVNVKDMVNVGSFLCNNFTNTGKLTLEHDSILLINDKGTVNNVVLGSIDTNEGQGNASLGRGTKGSINLKGTFTTPDEDMQLNAFVTDGYKDKIGDPIEDIHLWDEAGHDKIEQLLIGTTVFTTENKAFPVENINVLPYKLGETDEDNPHNAVYQKNKELKVTGNYIHVDVEYAGGESSKWLKDFAAWKDAVNYINALNNTSARYIITLDNGDIEGMLSLPTKAAHLVIRSGKGYYNEEEKDENENPIWESETITLKRQGDIALNTDTTFENIKFASGESIDTKGKQLEFSGTSGTFKALKGTKTTTLIFSSDAKVKVTSKVSGIDSIEMYDRSNLEINGGLSVNTIYSGGTEEDMYNSIHITGEKSVLEVKDRVVMDYPLELWSEGTVKVKDLITNCEENSLLTGKPGSITITGTVSSDKEDAWNTQTYVAGAGEKDASGNIIGYREVTNADYKNGSNEGEGFKDGITPIEVMPYAITLGNADDDVVLDEIPGAGPEVALADAKLALPVWFTVLAKYRNEESALLDVPHKKGNSIMGGLQTDANITLCLVKNENENVIGQFATLQEAFTEIDKIGDKEAEYLIQLNASQTNNKDFTLPSKAANVTIRSNKNYTITYKNKLTLKSNLTLEDVALRTTNAGTIALSDYTLTLNGVDLEENKLSVTGSAVTKGSKLIVEDVADLVFKKIDKVGALCLSQGATVKSTTTTLVGDLCVDGDQAALIGLGSITITNIAADNKVNIETKPKWTADKKTGNYTKSAPALTILGTVDGTVSVKLLDQKDTTLSASDDRVKDLIGKDGIYFAKAANATAEGISISEFEDGYIYKKSGILVYKKQAPQVELKYAVSEDKETKVVCETYADAISEINALKTKRDYTITFLASSSSKPANETTVENPVTLTMPKAGVADTLTLTAQDTTEVYFKGDITCNSHVILEDIDFTQVVAQKGINVEVTELDSYPNPIKFKVNGAYTLDVNGKVTFNNALALDGSGKAGLTLENGDTLCAVISHTATGKEGLYLEGSIKSFASVNLTGCEAKVLPYATGKRNQNTYKAAEVNVTALNASDVLLTVGDESLWEDKNVKSTFTVKNLNMAGGECTVYGDASLTNVTVTAANNSNPEIAVTGQKFAIAGNVTAASPATFTTAFNNKKQSALTINGDVVLTKPDNKITVDVDVTAGDPFADVDKTKSNALYLGGSYTNTSGKNVTISNTLLTAKKADATAFHAGETALKTGNKKPFGSESASNGYILSKTGSDIKVHYAEGVKAALYIGDAVKPYNYYTSFNEAVAVIDGMKDKNAEYRIEVLQDVGSESVWDEEQKKIVENYAFEKVNLPTQASKVTITSENKKRIFFSNNLTLASDVEFKGVILQYQKSSQIINVQGYDLILNNVIGKIGVNWYFNNEKQAWEKSDSLNSLCSLDGGGKDSKVIIRNCDGLLRFIGYFKNVTNYIQETKWVFVNGETAITNFTFKDVENSVSEFDTEYAKVTIANVINKCTNTEPIIRYGADKNVNPYLTIKGDITNASDSYKLVLETHYTVDRFTTQDGKVVLENKNKLATLEKALPNKVQFDTYSAEDVCWADGAYYLMAENFKTVVLSDGINTIKCLDLTQASNYINARADQNAEYSISLAENVTDTCLTDSGARSTLTLPSTDKMKKLTVKSGSESDRTTISLTGDVKVSGDVAFENILFDNDQIFSITCEENSDVKEYGMVTPGSGGLTWKNSGIARSGKQIKDINGKKGNITLKLEASNLDMTGGITGVRELELTQNAELTTREKSDVANVWFSPQENEWKAFGTTTIGYIMGSGTLGTALVGGAPQLTVNYDVPASVYVKLYENGNALTTKEAYQNKPLLIAKFAPANKFVAYGMKNDAEITAYKDSRNYVYNGDISEMEVELKDRDNNATYVRTYADAINIINNIGNKDGVYKITLLETDDNQETTDEDTGRTVIKTALVKDGSGSATYGKLVLPNAGKARSLTIESINKDNPAIIKYTGALSPLGNMELKLENVILTEGTIIKDDKTGDGFNETDSITLNLGTANIILGNGVSTPNAELKATRAHKSTILYGSYKNNHVDYNVFVNKISAKSGTLTLDKNQKVFVNGDASVSTLEGSVGAAFATFGKLTAGDVQTGGEESAGTGINAFVIIGKNAITLGNISGVTSAYIKTAYTAKDWKKATTQLTINGEVSNTTKLGIEPYFYDTKAKEYVQLDSTKTADIKWDGNSKPAAYQKVIQAPKMALDNLSLEAKDSKIYSGEESRFSKMDGGVYLLNDSVTPSIQVEGSTYDEHTGDPIIHYKGTFCTWDQAVKEIDKLNHTDWIYDIRLLKELGYGGTLKNLTMPSKAKKVRISGITGSNREYIMMTGTNITLKTDTEISVMILAVKKSGNKYYDTPYTINVGKNHLLLDDVINQLSLMDGVHYAPQIKLTGASTGVADIKMKVDRNYTGIFNKISGIGTVHFMKDRNSHYKDVVYTVPEGISGVGTLTIDPGVTVESKEKDVSVKNLVIGKEATLDGNGYEEPSEGESASLLAKNITVSNTATLASSYMRAGTRTVGDGKVTLNNVIVKDIFNTIEAKQNKNGKSQVQIKGTVSLANPTICPDWSYITVGLYYNNSITKYAPLTEGMVLLNAPKASTSLFWPNAAERDKETGTIISENMGSIAGVEVTKRNEDGDPILNNETGAYKTEWVYTHGLYRLGNDIVYGRIRDVEKYVDDSGKQCTDIIEKAEVRLWMDGDVGTTSFLDFATFEEAVKAIDSMALQKEVTLENGKTSKIYQSYTLELLHDIEIGNEKGNNKYNALPLPSKSSDFVIKGNGNSILFTGNITLKCNTKFSDVNLVPVKTVKNELVPANVNFAIGAYKAILHDGTKVRSVTDGEKIALANVTGSAKGELILSGEAVFLRANNVMGMGTICLEGDPDDKTDGNLLAASGNITAKLLLWRKDHKGVIECKGTLTTDAIQIAENATAWIYTNADKPVKVNGTTVVYDEGVKKNVSVLTANENQAVVLIPCDMTTEEYHAKVEPGMKVVTGKYLDASDWKVANYNNGNFYSIYKNGNDLFAGNVLELSGK